ncbi:MAG: phosphotransferase [Acidobacteriota bacterium]|nr:phosphotransferase [Acidobacteriota bacterium]
MTFFLDPGDLPGITAFLNAQGWLDPNESIQNAERAGEGNMNCTLRVRTLSRSFILKQARPWVEKYPQIPAPANRAIFEARFYEHIGKRREVAAHMPALLGFDSDARLLMLEDLGPTEDVDLNESVIGELTQFLIALHTGFRGRELADVFSNAELRALNHEHVFVFPLRLGNGLDLDSITPGLAALAQKLQRDSGYRSEVTGLGELYLDARGPCLLHGDYFPGSWLNARDLVWVIDPEFCFFGPPEWDAGVMLGHLHLAGCAPNLIASISRLYAAAAPLDRRLTLRFAGVEIMRRLIGVAQLPLAIGLKEKARLLDLSRKLVLTEGGS